MKLVTITFSKTLVLTLTSVKRLHLLVIQDVVNQQYSNYFKDFINQVKDKYLLMVRI
jgi:hypothetical protein